MTQLLNRIGFQTPLQVTEFLKSHEGKVTLTLISQEIIKIEELNQQKAELYREDLLNQQRHLVALLMKLMVKNEELAKQVSEIIQQRIEHKIKETTQQNGQSKTERKRAVDVIDATIKAYTETLCSLDKKLHELEQEVAIIDEQLRMLDHEGVVMTQRHAHLDDHIEQLNAYLQFPMSHDHSMENYIEHTEQQIKSLFALLSELPPQNNETTPEEQPEHPAKQRKIKMLEHQLAFHQLQLEKKPRSPEHVYKRLLKHVRRRLHACEDLYKSEPSEHLAHELEGLRLQERGVLDMLQVLRKEKVFLNAELEEVDDFKEAHFVVAPEQKARFQKRGNEYAICTEDMDPNNLSDDDWLQAQLNYDNLKHEVRAVPVHHHECVRQDVEKHQERKQHYKNLRKHCGEQIGDAKACKKQILHELSKHKVQRALLTQSRENTPLEMSPRPNPMQAPKENNNSSPQLCPKPRHRVSKCSYSFMMPGLERLVPEETKVLQKEVPEGLEDNVSPEPSPTPSQVMSAEIRFGRLDRAKMFVPETIIDTELEPTSYKLN